MAVNQKITPRPLSPQEKENRKKGVYDSFANYLVFCPACRRVRKSNMYLQRAETYIGELNAKGEVCACGANEWTLGYPMGTTTGFVKY